MSAVPTVFEGEVQLLRWSETSNQGATITLQLSNPDDLERFKTMTLAKGKQGGQRLMAAMVEIGEDEQPVEQPAKDGPKTKPGELCIMACNFCADPLFREWVVECLMQGSDECEDEEMAKLVICEWCEIETRKELDTNPLAAKLFHQHIRIPFLTWRDARRAA